MSLIPRRPGQSLFAAGLASLVLILLAIVISTPVSADNPPPTSHPVEGREACSTCHKPGGPSPTGSPANHSAFADQMCLGCHPTVGAAQPAPTKAPAGPTVQPTAAAGGPPTTNHPVAGREACTTCHKAGAGPIGANHAAYADSTCLGCHPTGGATQPTAQPTAAAKPTEAPAPSGASPSTPTPRPAAGTTGPQSTPGAADACLGCHGSSSLVMKLPSGETLSIYIDGEKMAQSVHGVKLQCTSCHKSVTSVPHSNIGATTVREFRVAQYEACKTCHGQVYETYLTSIHGKALKLENNPDVPVCGDCHGTHGIKVTDGPTFRLDSPEMCATCHANADKMARYGLSPNVFKTYSQDFHGATVKIAKMEAMPHQVNQAVCYDCHGVHDVKSLRSGDPVQVRQRVLEACQKCHPNAGESFPNAWLGHYELSFEQAPAAWIARVWYLAFIPFMVGGMAIHIGADLYRSRRRR